MAKEERLSPIEKLKYEFMRKGDVEKARYLETLERKLTPSQIIAIQQNDKSVLRELVLPSWVSWDLLREWAREKQVGTGRRCILCSELSESGIDFNEKFICEQCFLKLKYKF
jgi:hypothetical protein